MSIETQRRAPAGEAQYGADAPAGSRAIGARQDDHHPGAGADARGLDAQSRALDLRRTAAALAEHDGLWAALEHDADAMTGAQIDAGLDHLAVLQARVGEAFAADTADRNDPETARQAAFGPMTWLRALVASEAARGAL